MGRVLASCGAGIVLALAVVIAAAWADEEVPVSKLPKQVKEAIKTRFKDAKLVGAGKGKEDGKLLYEVAIKHKKRDIDVTVTSAGAITIIERVVPKKDLPGPVASALAGKYPKASYEVVEVFNVDGKEEKFSYYEAFLLTAKKERLSVQLGRDGKILKEAKAKPVKKQGK
jgi:hypothetical protein